MEGADKYITRYIAASFVINIIALVIVIYAAFMALMMTSPLVNFGGNYFVRSLLFIIIIVATLFHPILGLSLMAAILLTYQYYYTKSYINYVAPQALTKEAMEMVAMDNIKNNDNYIVADNYPEAYDNNSLQYIWPQQSPDVNTVNNMDGQDPRNNFYPSFVNEIVPDSYDARRAVGMVDGFDDRDAFERQSRRL